VDAVTGIITTVAGNGTAGFSGDGGPAPSSQLAFPIGVAVDMADNIFVADEGSRRVRRVDARTGIITTVAGGGSSFPGDGGPATSAILFQPVSVALDGAGNLFIADEGSELIQRVDAQTGVITTVAGNGAFGSAGDGGSATAAPLSQPVGITFGPTGDLFIAGLGDNRVRRVAGVGVPSPPVGCGFSLSPSRESFTAQGGLGSFNLNTGAGCDWFLSFSDAWIAPVSPGPLSPGGGPPRGAGPRKIIFSVAANTGAARSGSISVGGQSFDVNQQGFSCTIFVNPGRLAFAGAGGNSTLVVNAPPGCFWSATSNDSWITIVSGGDGFGSGRVILRASPNTDGARSGTININGIAGGTIVSVLTVSVAQSPTTGGGPTPTCGSALDVTANVRVQRLSYQPVPYSIYLYTQHITVTNTSGSTIRGPLFIVFVGLPNLQSQVGIVGFPSLTSCFSPQGDTVGLLSGGDLAPGASVDLQPLFATQNPFTSPQYVPKVLSGQPPLL
jgi:hypothetical protein